MRWKWALTATVAAAGLIAGIAALLIFGLGDGSGSLELAIQDLEGTQGDVVVSDVLLRNSEASIAGFELTIAVADPDIAEIVRVEFPDYSDPVSGARLVAVREVLPSPSVTIAAADIAGYLAGPFAEKALATVSISLLAPGETQVVVQTVHGLDDRQGVALSPALVPGSLVALPPLEERIRVSRAPDRSYSIPLDRQTVSGVVYVFVSMEAQIESVRFYIDDPGLTGTPVANERIVPWDLAGGSPEEANPYDTEQLTNGRHRVTAVVELATGETLLLNAAFMVDN